MLTHVSRQLRSWLIFDVRLKNVTPRDYQTIGSYLDVAFLFVAGALLVFIPKKLIGTKGTEEERQKKTKILKVCGGCMLAVAIVQMLLKVI